MSRIRDEALARLPALRAAYPAEFRAVTPGRAMVTASFLFGTVLLGIGIWRLEIDPARLLSGFGQLLHFLTLMVPPDPGSAAIALAILRALAETLAIAFLGTSLAADKRKLENDLAAAREEAQRLRESNTDLINRLAQVLTHHRSLFS